MLCWSENPLNDMGSSGVWVLALHLFTVASARFGEFSTIVPDFNGCRLSCCKLMPRLNRPVSIYPYPCASFRYRFGLANEVAHADLSAELDLALIK